jgi:hypothetical protein
MPSKSGNVPVASQAVFFLRLGRIHFLPRGKQAGARS